MTSTEPPFPVLFSPFRIGGMTVDNRIVFPATSTELADPDGFVTDAMVEFYAERARGGAGLIVVEATYVEQAGRRLRFNAMSHDDRMIPGLRRLAEAIRKEGARAVLQIAHGGREARPEITGERNLAPSAIPSQFTSVGEPSLPKELTPPEIARIVRGFAEAARRCKEASFDAVELHGAHGYLIGQFVSPLSNRREDDYGGDTRKRTRFYTEIIRAIKRRVGADYPVICRINGRDAAPGGLEVDEAAEVAALLEEAGADSISVSAGIHASRPYAPIPGMSTERGCHAGLAAAIRARVSIPVMAVGRINTADVAERILSDGNADFVCLSRALIADPHFPNKARAGDVDSIVPCIACNECIATVHKHNGIACTMNPAASRELQFRERLSVATSPKTVVVVGGGIAGMASALIAARRGHRVHLLERSDQVGGQLLLAYRPPHREELHNALAYFTRSLAASGVRVQRGHECDVDDIVELDPDHVIVATGAASRLPDVPGSHLPHVAFGWEVIAQIRKVGQTCVVVGGGLVGVEVADYLAERGHRAVLVVRSGLLQKAVRTDHIYYMDRIAELNIEVLLDTQLHEIGDDWVKIQSRGRIPRVLTGIDNVIICAGYEPRRSIADALKERDLQVTLVGDVNGPRKFFAAVEEGTLAGLSV